MTAAPRAAIEIIEPGPLLTVQDSGRWGSVHYGVSPSGAIDPRALDIANRRLGNPPHAAVLESLLGGFVFRLNSARWCALAGARTSVRIDGEPVDSDLFLVPAGALVEVSEASRGLYAVLAVAGGVRATLTLGSASCDTLSGIGPSPLSSGETLELDDPGPASHRCHVPNVALPAERAEIGFFWGPRDTGFSAADRDLLVRTEWVVSRDTNRVGARLDGARLQGGDGTLPSEGIMTGSIQIPPSGQPIVFLADRPVTGGYPVIGVVDETHLGLLAQVRPGSAVRFRPLRL